MKGSAFQGLYEPLASRVNVGVAGGRGQEWRMGPDLGRGGCGGIELGGLIEVVGEGFLDGVAELA